MLEVREKNNISPICPHCESTLTAVWSRQLGAFLGKRYIYFCPKCSKVLGVSHRKGFWMG